jgi:hypothetical protein
MRPRECNDGWSQRLVSRRMQLVRHRVRENQIHAVLQRQLKRHPAMLDVFGLNGRAWLSSLHFAHVSRSPSRRVEGAFELCHGAADSTSWGATTNRSGSPHANR